MIQKRSHLKQTRRLVLKIGSSLLTNATTGVQQTMIDRIVEQVVALHRQGIEVCLVSSGSVSLGRVALAANAPCWLSRSLSVHEKQAAAAVGQPALMQAYHQTFAAAGLKVAQMLLTRDDLRHRRRYLNASNTAETLFSAGVVPIVNENDTVVVEEIKFGDNDALAALVGRVIGADLVVLATDVQGLYDANPVTTPTAQRIADVHHVDERILGMASGSGSSFGTGGMQSKVRAAEIATRAGVVLAIVGGQHDQMVTKLINGGDLGTVFYCNNDRHNRRQHWIAELLEPEGALYVDAGAEQAMLQRGASLLPIGLQRVEGDFDKGDCVAVVACGGQVIAKGLVNYNNKEMSAICGMSSEQIEQCLGFVDYTSVIHRDNLVILQRSQVKL
ncbi:MAG: glutamate 5-kinase [Mariprofundaceae bacterium]|nr:glutamate 5-kinase [Mariprofundaceae bacterium]